MSVELLPLRNDAKVFSFIVNLSGEDFGFRFYWNDQDEAWYFELSDQTNAPIRNGVRVVLGGLAIGALPLGILVCFDQSNTHTEPGLEDLGDRVQIAYRTAV